MDYGQEMPAEREGGALPEDTLQRLDALGRKLSETRKEAIDARLSLGIEQEWEEDEEAYNGIDEHNRNEYRTSPNKGDPLGSTRTRGSEEDPRSTVVPNITGPYCDAAAARLADMLLPVDEQPFEIGATPIPELEKMVGDTTPVQLMDGDGTMVESTRGEYIKAQIEAAKEPARAAQREIDDYLAECRWTNEVRTVIEDSARVGTGVLKGPVPMRKRRFRWVNRNGFDALEVDDVVNPTSHAVSVWDCFPDLSCGESIHDGNYHWERGSLTRRQLTALKGTDGYIDAQIDACLDEGPQAPEPFWTNTAINEPTPLKDRNKFQVWYYYGCCKREDWLAAQPLPVSDEQAEEIALLLEDMDDDVHVCAVMVNHRVIKLKRNPLDNGAFPYDYMIWRRRPGMPFGQGIARLIRTPQRMVTAATRNLMDNAGLGGGPIVIVDPEVIEPIDGKWTLHARKFFAKADGAMMADAEKAFAFKTIDMVTAELQQIIHLGFRFAEECTGLPAILQGQMGEKAPDRVGIVEMLQNNGSATLRRLAKLFDDRITEPHITRYYHWLMQYSDNPEVKGDFEVITKGSSALVERGLQNQELVAMLPLALDPRYGMDPEKVAEEYLRSRHFDPKRFQMDPEKKAALAAQQDPLAQAEAEVKRADAILKGAQAKKVAAEAIAVGVRTQYEGIQGGQVLVAVPGVAPVTDVLIKNAADGLDATDQLPEPTGQPPAALTAEDLLNRRTGMRVAQNGVQTSPNLPPVPESPGAGAAEGIETPAGDGVRR